MKASNIPIKYGPSPLAISKKTINEIYNSLRLPSKSIYLPAKRRTIKVAITKIPVVKPASLCVASKRSVEKSDITDINNKNVIKVKKLTIKIKMKSFAQSFVVDIFSTPYVIKRKKRITCREFNKGIFSYWLSSPRFYPILKS
jgi:hypothetical protein